MDKKSSWPSTPAAIHRGRLAFRFASGKEFAAESGKQPCRWHSAQKPMLSIKRLSIFNCMDTCLHAPALHWHCADFVKPKKLIPPN